MGLFDQHYIKLQYSCKYWGFAAIQRLKFIQRMRLMLQKTLACASKNKWNVQLWVTINNIHTMFIMLYKVVVTVQMKATEWYFPVELFDILYKVVPTFECLWMKSGSVTIQMKATKQYFGVWSCCKARPTFVECLFVMLLSKSVDEIVWGHNSKHCRVAFFCCVNESCNSKLQL